MNPVSTLRPSVCCVTITLVCCHSNHTVFPLSCSSTTTLNAGSLHLYPLSILYVSWIYANMFYPDACRNSSACLILSSSPPLLLSSLPFCSFDPFGHKQMGPSVSAGFCSRFLPVKTDFFLATVASVLALEGVQVLGSVKHLKTISIVIAAI